MVRDCASQGKSAGSPSGKCCSGMNVVSDSIIPDMSKMLASLPWRAAAEAHLVRPVRSLAGPPGPGC